MISSGSRPYCSESRRLTALNHTPCADQGAVRQKLSNPKMACPGKWKHGLKPVATGGLILTYTHRLLRSKRRQGKLEPQAGLAKISSGESAGCWWVFASGRAMTQLQNAGICGEGLMGEGVPKMRFLPRPHGPTGCLRVHVLCQAAAAARCEGVGWIGSPPSSASWWSCL